MAIVLRRTRRSVQYLSWVLLPLFLWTSAARAAPLDPSALQMFPKNVIGIGYADLDAARKLTWFPQFAAQVVPVSLYEFDRFLSAAQMQSSPSMAQVVWARFLEPPTDVDSTPRLLLAAIATGRFDVDTIQSFLQTRKIPAITIEGRSAYSSQTGGGSSAVLFTFIDQNTIAFGSPDALGALLRVRAGAEDSFSENAAMLNEVDQVNGNNTLFWGVLARQNAQAAVDRLFPILPSFPQARDLLDQIGYVAIAASDLGEIELNLQATTASPSSTALLSQLLQAGLLYQQYEKGRSNPDLARILSGVNVAPNGNDLEISVGLSDDQMLRLIEHNTFQMSF